MNSIAIAHVAVSDILALPASAVAMIRTLGPPNYIHTLLLTQTAMDWHCRTAFSNDETACIGMHAETQPARTHGLRVTLSLDVSYVAGATRIRT